MSLTETGDGVSQERFPSAEINHLGSNKLLKYLRQYWKNRHWTQVVLRDGCINFWNGTYTWEFPGTREVQLRNTVNDDHCVQQPALQTGQATGRVQSRIYRFYVYLTTRYTTDFYTTKNLFIRIPDAGLLKVNSTK